MKFNFMRFSAFALMAVFMASCANINIVKRTHRPGYHVDVVKKKDRKVENAEEQITNKVTPQPEQKMVEMEPNTASVANEISAQAPLLTSSAEATPIVGSNSKLVEKPTKRQYKLSDFRWTGKKKKSYKKPMFSSDDHWSAWVAFFTGAASLMFAFIALIVAFFGYAVWPAAIVLGVAAIVFTIINKKNGWSGERMRKLGLLFGIIGAGVGLIATIIWAVWLALVL